MKYVFVINSHTTFLTALGTIDYLKLSENEIYFLYIRNYENSIIKVPYITENITIFQNVPLNKNRVRDEFISRFDSFINNKISSEYELFVPHLGNGLFQLLYTHPFCKKVSYIQEGGVPFKAAYKTHLSLFEKLSYGIYNKFILQTKRVWKPFKWYLKGSIKEDVNLDSYAISNTFFRYLPSNNKIIRWPNIHVSVTIEEHSTIFIFDGFAHHGFIEKELYMQLCGKLIKENCDKKNYIRFHPAQDSHEREYIKSIFKEMALPFEIMDENIPFELIISSTSNLKVAGFGSSLLFFAKDYGHTVICKDKWLSESKLYRKYKQKYGFEWFETIYK